MLEHPVSLHDVRDVESFIQATINASGRTYTQDMREDLVAEGLRIMVDLAKRFEPQRDGYAQPGRFSGFAAKYLPLKLEDAYHRLCPEHQLRVQADGRRVWEYGEKAVSLEALTADDPDRHGLLAVTPASSEDIEGWLRRSLTDDSERMIQITLLVARERGRAIATGERLSDEQLAERLGLSVPQVRERNAVINAVGDRPKGTPLVDALRARNTAQIDLAVGVGCLLVDEYTVPEIAEMLGVDPAIIRDCMLLIARVRSSLETFANGREAA